MQIKEHSVVFRERDLGLSLEVVSDPVASSSSSSSSGAGKGYEEDIVVTAISEVGGALFTSVQKLIAMRRS